ncbi:DUF4960 domain-containing protein [Olivibacter sitiensis]|uniref:DUF4960 domain-containing protein n=1 Tax=Olivibacter sitiensis TaxID=376470 RepID=UPI000684FD40|nr:DUF4960 domain-containing protein [Olivibacter sitiensis]
MLNFTGTVAYRITNGNLYKDYEVIVRIVPPLNSFAIEGVEGNIDHGNKSVSLLLPDGMDLSALSPQVEVQNGISVSPASGAVQDFTEPVTYTFTAASSSVEYTVTVISNSIYEYAFLGTAASRDAIADDDEKAAADWFFANYPESDYISFQSIGAGRRLSNYKVIWWHHDASQDLPAAATNATVVNALKAYRAQGGGLLLTTYAALYLETLGVVPAGKGPNNVFGDFGDGGFIEYNDDWGISFRGRESHPIFQGIETYDTGKANLLSKGTFRKNHTAWWFLPEWGGYGNAATWREQTGGINLASEAWDDYLDGRVGIAEWPSAGLQGNVVVITFGAYDWYSEPRNGGSDNAYIGNIQRLTKNAIDYIKND